MPKVLNNDSRICADETFWMAIQLGDTKQLADLSYSQEQLNGRDYKNSTPLHVAVNKNNLNLVLFLLNEGTLIEPKDNDNLTPLEIAVKKGYLDIVKALMLRLANSHELIKSRNLLYVAVENVQAEMVDFLLTQLHLIPDNKELLNKALLRSVQVRSNGNELKIIRSLLLYKTDVETIDPVTGNKPLHNAVNFFSYYNDPKPIELLISYGANINASNNRGETPLHIAAISENLNIVTQEATSPKAITSITKVIQEVEMNDDFAKKFNVTFYLLSKGADVKAQDREGNTPLHVVSDKRPELANFLIKRSAPLEAKNNLGQTPLHYAAMHGKVELVKVLLEHNTDVNAIDNEGMQLIHCATMGSNIWLIERLLEKHVDINARNAKGETALWIATKANKPEIVKLLQQHGAKLALTKSDAEILIFDAVADNNIELTQSLLKEFGNLETTNSEGETPLHVAINNMYERLGKRSSYSNHNRSTATDELACVKLLLEHGANTKAALPSDENFANVTPLKEAFTHDFEDDYDGFYSFYRNELIKLLLQYKADTNTRSQSFKSSRIPLLHTVIRIEDKQRLEWMKLLLEHGADPNIKDQWNRKDEYKEVNTALHCIADFRFKEDPLALDIAKILLERGANLEITDSHGLTPLSRAIECDNLEVAKFFIEQHANIEAKDEKGETPLFKARSLELVTVLVEKGADLKVTNIRGETLLFNAVENSQCELAKYFIEHGVDLEARNRDGMSSLQIAIRKVDLGMVQLLLEHGANPNTEWVFCKDSLTLAKETNNEDLIKLLQPYLAKKAISAQDEAKSELTETDLKKKRKQLVELKQQVATLNSQINDLESFLHKFEEKAAVTIQKIFRGYHERKKQPLSTLKEQRKKEILEKSGEIMSKFVKEGKFEQIAKLANAIQNQHWHEAMQIIRGIPEKEMSLKIPNENDNTNNNNNNTSSIKTITFKY